MLEFLEVDHLHGILLLWIGPPDSLVDSAAETLPQDILNSKFVLPKIYFAHLHSVFSFHAVSEDNFIIFF